MVQSRSRGGVQFVTAMLAILSAATISACGSDSGSGPTELSWFIFNEPSGAFVKAADACTKQSNGEYEIKFEYLPADADGQREQLVRRLGAEDSSIDIIGMDVIWTAEFANAGWIQEWKSPEKEEVTKNIFESVVTSATFDGKLYAAPFTSNTQLLWYRKDRVDKVPKTWEQMLERGREDRRRRPDPGPGQPLRGLRRLGQLDDRVSRGALPRRAREGLARGGPDGGRAEGDEPVRELAGRSAPTSSTSTEDTSRLSFEAGGSSFMLNYPFVYPSAKENAPDVFKQMGAARYPEVVPGKPSKPPLGGINLGISSYSAHSKEAFDAATCLVQPENQITAAELGGLPPTDSDSLRREGDQGRLPGLLRPHRRSRSTTPRRARRRRPTPTSRWRSSAPCTRSARPSIRTTSPRLRQAARLRRPGRQP